MFYGVVCFMVCLLSVAFVGLLLLYFEVEATWQQFWAFLDIETSEENKNEE